MLETHFQLMHLQLQRVEIMLAVLVHVAAVPLYGSPMGCMLFSVQIPSAPCFKYEIMLPPKWLPIATDASRPERYG